MMEEDRQNLNNPSEELEHEFLLLDHEIRKSRHHDLASALNVVSNALELISISTTEPVTRDNAKLAKDGMEAAFFLLNYNLDIREVEYKRRHSLNSLTTLTRREVSGVDLGFFHTPFQQEGHKSRSVVVNTGMLVQLIHLIIGSRRQNECALSLTVKESSLKWVLEFKSRVRLSELSDYKRRRAIALAQHSKLANRWSADDLMEAVASRVPAKVRRLVVDESATSATVLDVVELALEV